MVARARAITLPCGIAPLRSRTGRPRGELRPFRLALASAVFAVGTLWLSLVDIFPSVWSWPYLGIAGLVGASLWIVLEQQPGSCIDEIILEAQQRQGRGSPARRLAMRTLTAALAVVMLYGLHVSVAGFVPG